MKQYIEKYYEDKGEACRFRIKIRKDIPFQQNSVDCGVFLLTFAERISRKASFNFQRSHMSLFRWKIAWEILNGSVKEFILVKDERKSTTQDCKAQEGKRKLNKKEAVKKEDAEHRRKTIKWPAGNSDEWKKLDTDLTMMLREIGRSPEAKADLHPKFIYKYCLMRFGEIEATKKHGGNPSRRQSKGQKLRKDINALKEAWKEAPEEEKSGIQELQSERIKELRLLKRAESIRSRRKKQKQNSDSFFKQPFSFARKVLDPEVKGNLTSTKEEVEEYLKKAHSDANREKELGEIEGLYEYPEPEFEYDTAPPTLQEFQAVLKKARMKSAAGPNGVPYRVYKKCPGVARLLWNYIKGLWRKNQMSDT